MTDPLPGPDAARPVITIHPPAAMPGIVAALSLVGLGATLAGATFALLTVVGQRQAAPADLAACQPAAAVTAGLASTWGETAVLSAITDGAPNTVIQIAANPETGTWTMIETMPDGTACWLSSGTGFALTLPKQGDPA